MKGKAKGQAGFSILELLIACALLAFLMGTVMVAVVAYRKAIAFTGSETISGVVWRVNPDDSTVAQAKTLLAEVAALESDVSYVVCTDRPLAPSHAESRQWLPELSSLSTDDVRDPSRVANALATAGLSFSGDGFSVLFVGKSNRLTAALVCSSDTGPSSGGVALRTYEVRLFGDYGNGYGLLARYAFATPSSSAQPLVMPEFAAGLWNMILPDPGLPSDASVPLTSESSGLRYGIPSNI